MNIRINFSLSCALVVLGACKCAEDSAPKTAAELAQTARAKNDKDNEARAANETNQPKNAVAHEEVPPAQAPMRIVDPVAERPAYGSEQPFQDLPPRADERDGRALFMNHCATCHAGDGRARLRNARPGTPDLSDSSVQGRLADGQIYKAIAFGHGGAKQYSTLMDAQQITMVVEFVRTLVK